MTEEEQIIKALECCAQLQPRCDECPDRKELNLCGLALKSQALKLINRQKAEIERLQDYNENLRCINTDLSNNLLDEVETARAEAVKEFAEMLKEYTHDIVLYGEIVTMSRINNLVKEFTEEKT